MMLVVWGLVGLRRRRNANKAGLLLVLVAAAGLFGVLSGCGDGGSSHSGGNGTPMGTSTVTVTATSGAMSQSTTLQLTVN